MRGCGRAPSWLPRGSHAYSWLSMNAQPSVPPEHARVTTLDLDPGRFRLCVWQNISVTLWTDRATLDAGRRILKIGRELAQRFPQGRSQVMLIAARAPAPDAATSELLAEVYDPERSGIVCIAAVLEGEGFWASGIRSRMTNMRIAAGSKIAMQALSSIDEVATWLPDEHLERTGVTIGAEALRTALVEVRQLGT